MFDSKFTKMTPVDSPCEQNISLSVNPFEGFTYVAPSVLEEMQKPKLTKAGSPLKNQWYVYFIYWRRKYLVPVNILLSTPNYGFITFIFQNICFYISLIKHNPSSRNLPFIVWGGMKICMEVCLQTYRGRFMLLIINSFFSTLF